MTKTNYSNYIANLTSKQRKKLADFLGTSTNYLRLYYSGKRSPLSSRIIKIIDWARQNTPDNIPTFEELINNKESV